MPLSEDVSFDKAIDNAIEASFYLCALHAGLTHAELTDILRRLGAGAGEATDAIEAHYKVGKSGTYSKTGRIFWSSEEQSPHPWTFNFSIPFSDDPRDPKACAFVQRHFKTIAANRGIKRTVIGYEEIVDVGTAHGFDRRSLDYAIAMLQRNKLVEREKATNLYRPTDAIRTYGILGEQLGDMDKHPRALFGQIVELVRAAIDARESGKEHAALHNELRSVALPNVVDPHDEVVLRFAIARFLDSRRNVLLDDIVRQFESDLDGVAIATRLVDAGWLLRASTTDPRALAPTVRAVALRPERHAEVLAIVDGCLRRAKSFWDEGRERIALASPVGLVDNKLIEEPPYKVAVALLASVVPALVISGESVRTVEIRREIVSCNTLANFLRFSLPAAPAVAAISATRTKDEPSPVSTAKGNSMTNAADIDLARPILNEIGWVLPRDAKPLAAGGGGAVYKCYRRSLVDAVTKSREPSTDETALVEQILTAGPEASCAALKVAHRFDERLAREIAAMQKVEDNHLVRVLARDERPQPTWYLMEFLDGGMLHRKLDGYRGNAAKTLRDALSIARALAHLHAVPLVHRDVKTKNIFLRRSGDLVLGDLGIVFDPQASRLTTYESPMSRDWTPRWRPEDLDTPARDVYSLARVIYAMLTGDKLVEPEWLADADNQLATLFPGDAAMPVVDRLMRDHIVARRAQCASQDGQAFVAALEDTLDRVAAGRQMLPLIVWGSGFSNPGSGPNKSLDERPILIPSWTRRLTARFRYRHAQHPQLDCTYDVTLEDGKTKLESPRITMKPQVWYEASVDVPKRAVNDWCTFSLRSDYAGLISEFTLYALSY